MKKFLHFATAASVLGIAGVVSATPAQANEPLTEVDRLGNQIQRLTGREPMSQVTAISQLSDVRPTDWAFTALQSLVERYNCIAGYPNRTYRGNQAMTRYEFAAGLNACLDKINEIIASGLADKVSRDDLAAIQKLQEEFAAELATLRGRVDSLEGKVATLEAQQFSTTTKLEGQAIFAISGATDKNTVFVARSRLNLNTSFTGNDLLVTRLDSGNAPNNQNNRTPYLDYATAGTGVTLSTLRYDFKIGKEFSVSAGVMNAFDLLDTNSYANNEAVDFSNTFFLNNQLLLPVASGSGLFAKFTPNQGRSPFYISALYYGDKASEATPGALNPTGGLFGENNQLTVELGYVPTDKDGNIPFALKLQYTRASLGENDPTTTTTSTRDVFGANLEWAFAKGAALFGRFGIASRTRTETALILNTATTRTDTPIYWAVGFAFPNLFKKGALAGIGVGQPQANVFQHTQTNLELFYNYPISDNIRITPDIQFIFSPDNQPAPTVFVGTLRTVFSF